MWILSKSVAHNTKISEILMHYAKVRSVKTIIVIEGKLAEKEETESASALRKRAEDKKIIDSAPALAYVI